MKYMLNINIDNIKLNIIHTMKIYFTVIIYLINNYVKNK